MEKFPSLTIVLPAYNEEGNIEKQTDTCFAFLNQHVEDGRVIVVNDGSRDGTAAVLENLKKKYPKLGILTHPTNFGYGATLRDGFLACETEWLFYTDSDNQFDVNEVAGFLTQTANCDAVFGFRMDRQDPFLRKFLSWGFNTLVRMMFGVRARDVDCAFKLFKREIFNQFTIESHDFFIDCEVLAKMQACGYKTVEIGVHHYPRLAGSSSVKASDIPKTLRTMFKLWGKVRALKKSRSKQG